MTLSVNMIMEQLIKNANEFLDSGSDNLQKGRFNASVSDFFKSIVIFCDYLIYGEIRRLPKNHNDRFNLLRVNFEDIYEKVSFLFKSYIKSYNLSMDKNDAIKFGEYANELKKVVEDKK